MSGHWFTDSGSSGTVTIEWVNDGWEVIQPETEGTVKCILKGDGEISKSDEPQVVEGTASKYAIGMDDDPDYLYLLLAGSQSQKAFKDSEREWRILSNIEGTGDYINLEAIIKSVHAVNKSESGASDIRGRITDYSIDKSVLFVVEDGVKHPYLEEGATFKFSNVQDYYNKQDDKAQVRITNRTDITKISDSDSAESDYSKKEADVSTRGSGKKDNSSIQDNKDSTVGKAKKRARRENRDPAIDPHFQPDDR